MRIEAEDILQSRVFDTDTDEGAKTSQGDGRADEQPDREGEALPATNETGSEQQPA